MGASGKYYERVQRLVYGTTTDTNTNQSVASYTPGDVYWCRVTEKSASEQHTMGAKQHIINADIAINQFPALDLRDRLLDQRTGYTYQITGKVNNYDEYEMIVFCTRIPALGG